jgi:serine/threonine-protein kinase
MDPPSGTVKETKDKEYMDRLEANFGSYEIVEAIGRGTLGTVYRAKQVRLNREVAVKFIDAELAAVFSRDDFGEEAEALASLYHPNIAMVLDAGSAREQLFFVTELVDGLMLNDYIAAGSPDDGEVAGIISQICDGLTFAHEAGLLHLDLTPQHVLVNALGWIKLVDFRMSRAYLEGSAGSTEGDPYSRPELLGGDVVTPLADVYSIGKLLWFLVTGDTPPVHIDGDLDDLCADIPEHWRDVGRQAIKTDPAQRLQNIEEFRQAVLDAFDNEQLELDDEEAEDDEDDEAEEYYEQVANRSSQRTRLPGRARRKYRLDDPR